MPVFEIFKYFSHGKAKGGSSAPAKSRDPSKDSSYTPDRAEARQSRESRRAEDRAERKEARDRDRDEARAARDEARREREEERQEAREERSKDRAEREQDRRDARDEAREERAEARDARERNRDEREAERRRDGEKDDDRPKDQGAPDERDGSCGMDDEDDRAAADPAIPEPVDRETQPDADATCTAGNLLRVGTDADEFLAGACGNDELYGARGDDALIGGDGRDYLSGNQGADSLTGGRGADVFAFDGDFDREVVTDFDAAEGDTIQFTFYTPDRAAWTAETLIDLAVQTGADVVFDLPDGDETAILLDTELEELTPDLVGVVFHGAADYPAV